MLNIYTGRELIPKDMTFVNDNESYFKNVGFYNRAVVEPILIAIEQGQWRDATTYVDRFGVVLYSDFISTGAKTLINMSSVNYVFNGCEMGMNVIRYMLLCMEGNVLLKPMYMFEVDFPVNLKNIRVDGRVVSTTEELEELLCY